MQESKGEAHVVAIPTLYNGAEQKTLWGGSEQQDDKQVFINASSGRLQVVSRNSSGAIEYNQTPLATYPLGVEIEHRFAWDEAAAGVEGFRAIAYDVANDVQTSGTASPWAGASGGGYLSYVVVGGQRGSLRQLDGYIQSLKLYDGQNGNFA